MILSSAPVALAPGGALLLAGVTLFLYALAAVPAAGAALTWRRLGAAALLGAFVLHLLLLLIDIGGLALGAGGMRWGFGPVLSMTVWLMIAVHTVESRFLPLPSVRLALALAGIVGVVAALLFPGDPRHPASVWAPLHFALGVGSYGLFAAAVMHATWLDRAERRLRGGAAASRAPALAPATDSTPGSLSGNTGNTGNISGGRPSALPLLQLERLTFRFVEAGFVVLTLTLLLGIFTTAQWRWDHKSVFSLLAWGVFAALLMGRHRRGWRGRQATRWLYVARGRCQADGRPSITSSTKREPT